MTSVRPMKNSEQINPTPVPPAGTWTIEALS